MGSGDILTDGLFQTFRSQDWEVHLDVWGRLLVCVSACSCLITQLRLVARVWFALTEKLNLNTGVKVPFLFSTSVTMTQYVGKLIWKYWLLTRNISKGLCLPLLLLVVCQTGRWCCDRLKQKTQTGKHSAQQQHIPSIPPLPAEGVLIIAVLCLLRVSQYGGSVGWWSRTSCRETQVHKAIAVNNTEVHTPSLSWVWLSCRCMAAQPAVYLHSVIWSQWTGSLCRDNILIHISEWRRENSTENITTCVFCYFICCKDFPSQGVWCSCFHCNSPMSQTFQLSW